MGTNLCIGLAYHQGASFEVLLVGNTEIVKLFALRVVAFFSIVNLICPEMTFVFSFSIFKEKVYSATNKNLTKKGGVGKKKYQVKISC